MNNLITLPLLCALLMFLPFQAKADDGISVQGIMALSKTAGACGILNSMLYFQKTTQMPEGDKFIARFWATEAARLGKSMDQYSEKCNKAVSVYNKLWNTLEKTEQK